MTAPKLNILSLTTNLNEAKIVSFSLFFFPMCILSFLGSQSYKITDLNVKVYIDAYFFILLQVHNKNIYLSQEYVKQIDIFS